MHILMNCRAGYEPWQTLKNSTYLYGITLICTLSLALRDMRNVIVFFF